MKGYTNRTARTTGTGRPCAHRSLELAIGKEAIDVQNQI